MSHARVNTGRKTGRDGSVRVPDGIARVSDESERVRDESERVDQGRNESHTSQHASITGGDALEHPCKSSTQLHKRPGQVYMQPDRPQM